MLSAFLHCIIGSWPGAAIITMVIIGAVLRAVSFDIKQIEGLTSLLAIIYQIEWGDAEDPDRCIMTSLRVRTKAFNPRWNGYCLLESLCLLGLLVTHTALYEGIEERVGKVIQVWS